MNKTPYLNLNLPQGEDFITDASGAPEAFNENFTALDSATQALAEKQQEQEQVNMYPYYVNSATGTIWNYNPVTGQFEDSGYAPPPGSGDMSQASYDPGDHEVATAGGIPAYVAENSLGNVLPGSGVQITGDREKTISAISAGYTTFTHAKAGNFHNLTGPDGQTYISFIATSEYRSGEGVRINGTGVKAQTEGGVVLPDLAWVTGAYVTCVRGPNGALNFKVASGIPLDIYIGLTPPSAPRENMFWVLGSFSSQGQKTYGPVLPKTAVVDQIHVLTGNSNISIPNAWGDSQVLSPIAIARATTTTQWTGCAAAIRKGDEWKLFYPLDSLLNYCTCADAINQHPLDDTDAEGTVGAATAFVMDETAGMVAEGNGTATSFISWLNAQTTPARQRQFCYIGDCTIIAAMKTTNASGSRYALGFGATLSSTGTASKSLRINATGVAGISDGTNAIYTPEGINDGVWHALCIPYSYSLDIRQIWLDGDNVVDVQGATALTTTTTRYNLLNVPNAPSTAGYVGRLAHAFVYKTMLPGHVHIALSMSVLAKVQGKFN